MAFTTRGAYLLFNSYFAGAAAPTNFYVALVTNAVPPTVDVNTLGQLTQIALGSGYTDGGMLINRNTTDWDSRIEDDTDDRSEFQLKDLVWTASGGSLPASGDGARWAVLTTDEGTVANRQVIAFFNLVSDRTVSDGQALTLVNIELQGDTVP